MLLSSLAVFGHFRKEPTTQGVRLPSVKKWTENESWYQLLEFRESINTESVAMKLLLRGNLVFFLVLISAVFQKKKFQNEKNSGTISPQHPMPFFIKRRGGEEKRRVTSRPLPFLLTLSVHWWAVSALHTISFYSMKSKDLQPNCLWCFWTVAEQEGSLVQETFKIVSRCSWCHPGVLTLPLCTKKKERFSTEHCFSSAFFLVNVRIVTHS